MLECTCTFPDGKIYYDKIPLDCAKAWDVICSGNTKGVFQLESGLGKCWAQRVQPRSIEELADLISIIRRGVLESELDGKSLTKHYADRKSGKEEITYIHPALKPILEKTYGILVYQEQIMMIAKDLAGYDLSKADDLRKATGKKDIEKMLSHKDPFINSCVEVGIITKDIAEQIWDWIVHTATYSFNASHAVSYAIIGYYTAYAKAHLPIKFYCSYLSLSKDKIKPKEEIAELVKNAKSDKIPINPPCFKDLDKEDFYIKDGQIFFGLNYIKGIGLQEVEKIRKKVLSKSENSGLIIVEQIWKYILELELGKKLELIIQSGGLDYLGMPRQRMLYEYNIYNELSDFEKEWLKGTTGHLLDSLHNIVNSYISYMQDRSKKELKSTSSKTRLNKVKDLITLLENPPRSLEDSPIINLYKEKELLGTPITTSILEGTKQIGNCLCSEFRTGYDAENIIICARIARCSSYTVKNGKNAGKEMCFLTLEDDTGEVDAVVFSKEYPQFKDNLYEDNILGFNGERSYDGRSFVVRHLLEI